MFAAFLNCVKVLFSPMTAGMPLSPSISEAYKNPLGSGLYTFPPPPVFVAESVSVGEVFAVSCPSACLNPNGSCPLLARYTAVLAKSPLSFSSVSNLSKSSCVATPLSFSLWRKLGSFKSAFSTPDTSLCFAFNSAFCVSPVKSLSASTLALGLLGLVDMSPILPPPGGNNNTIPASNLMSTPIIWSFNPVYK